MDSLLYWYVCKYVISHASQDASLCREIHLSPFFLPSLPSLCPLSSLYTYTYNKTTHTGFIGKQLPWEDIAYNVGYPTYFNHDKIIRDGLLPDGFIPPATTFSDMYENCQQSGIIPKNN